MQKSGYMKPITFFSCDKVPNILAVIDKDLVILRKDLGYDVVDVSDPSDLRAGSGGLSNPSGMPFPYPFLCCRDCNLAIASKNTFQLRHRAGVIGQAKRVPEPEELVGGPISWLATKIPLRSYWVERVV